jgi:hypothetical protein
MHAVAVVCHRAISLTVAVLCVRMNVCCACVQHDQKEGMSAFAEKRAPQFKDN